MTDQLDSGVLNYARSIGNFGIQFVTEDRSVTLYANTKGIGLWDDIEAYDIWRIRTDQ